VLGLIADFIGSKLVNKRGEGFFLDIALGIVGAVIGGWLFSLFGMHGVTGLNIYSLVVAVIGAVVLLLIYHAARTTVTTRSSYRHRACDRWTVGSCGELGRCSGPA
jgi:uncharacterized membrane protein YeaQ/YmgE (transglycosylase-associated protein family)